MANKNYAKASNELKRAAKINGMLTDDIDAKIEQYNRQVLREETSVNGEHKRMGVWRSILAIFTNVHLLKDTMSVFLLLFVAEVVYFSLTLNVADLGGSLYINYVISGLSELVSIAFCAILLAYLSRRMCLSLLLLASTVSYLLMALVNVYEDSLSMTIILAVNAFGKLTAIGNLMVIILVSQEVFPTVIRQFGTSLCITVGKAGSAVAPFTHELGQTIGQSYCFAMFSIICLTCAIVPCVLSETGDRELPDTVGDVEEGEMRRKKRNKMISDDKRNGVPIDGDGIFKSKTSKDITGQGIYIAHYESNKSRTKIKNINEPNIKKANDDSNNNSYINNQGEYLGKLDKKNLGLTTLNNFIDQKQQPNSMIEDLNNNSSHSHSGGKNNGSLAILANGKAVTSVTSSGSGSSDQHYSEDPRSSRAGS